MVTCGMITASLTLVFSGVTKIAKPLNAALALVGYRLVGAVNQTFARLVGVAEVLVGVAGVVAAGIALQAPLILMIGSALTTTYAVFVVLQIVGNRRRATHPCGCFGGEGPPSLGGLVASLTMLVFSAAYLAIATTADPMHLSIREIPDMIQAVVAVFGLVFTVVATVELAQLKSVYTETIGGGNSLKSEST